MSLKPLESVETNTYFSTGNFSQGNWYSYGVPISGPPHLGFLYVDRLDAFMAAMNRDSSDPGSGIGQFDPLFQDNSGPIAKFSGFSGTPSFMAIGEWDKLAGVQKLYGGPNVSTSEFWPIDQNTLVMTDIGSSLWPFFWDASGGALATIGEWDDGPTAQTEADFVFFETWGYALSVKRVRHTDGNLYRGLAQIDLTTGAAVLLDVPVFYSATPGALFETFSFQADNFTLRGLQFVADDDSRPGAPKGRIFLHSPDFLSDLGNVNNTDWRQYLKVIEWNPLNASPTAGNAPRVHLREILFTRLNFFERQPFGTNANSLGDTVPTGSGIANGLLRTRYHPNSRTLVTINEMGNASTQNQNGYVRHSLVPILAEVQTPTNLEEIETNKTIRFRSRALGDIGDAVAGADATFTLERRSTLDEALDTSGGGATVTLGNIPVDIGTLVVELSGVPLVDGVDYTVVLATGVITWLAPQSPPLTTGYTATYRHTNTGAQPPFGMLLQLTAKTDESGIAETRVRYAADADLVTMRDRLDVEITDD